MPEAEEVLAAYETQKVIIAQLQDQLNEERSRSTELEQELRDEIDSLNKTCSDQQQLIHQVCKGGVFLNVIFFGLISTTIEVSR